jgi:hypothetical protein
MPSVSGIHAVVFRLTGYWAFYNIGNKLKYYFMATLSNNSLLQGMRGVLGGLVFKTVGDRTIVSTMPSIPRSRKGSPLQDLYRSKFKEASAYARVVTRRNHEQRAYYEQKAREMKLPNAYTAAITDFMRRGRIRSINTNGYTGKPGGKIIIDAHRKDFTVKEVNVTILTKAGRKIETGNATPTPSGKWIYKSSVDTSDEQGLTIIAGAMDHVGKTTHAKSTINGHELANTYGWGGHLTPPGLFIT